MNLDGINTVVQRIHSIEQRFGINNTTTAATAKTDFPAELQAQMQPSVENGPVGNRKKTAAATQAPGDVGGFITKAAQKYGVDPKLVSAVAEAESGYRPDAVSSTGAVGVMQLMPDTAAALGVTNAYDPQQNIEGGTKYLKEMLNDFGGDVRKAVAAYNAGPQAVKKYNGVPPYAETQNYVDKVLDLYQ
jgi:soluble lytic murein transglycosylase-like protein